MIGSTDDSALGLWQKWQDDIMEAILAGEQAGNGCGKRIGPYSCCSVVQGDCLELMKQLPDGAVDAVITDPPYSERTHRGHDSSASGHIGAGKDGSSRKSLGYSALSAERARLVADRFAELATSWIVWMTDHTLAPTIMDRLRERSRYVFAPLPFYAPGSRVRLSGDGPSSWTDWIVVSRTAAQVRWGTLPGGYVAGPGWDDKEHMGGKPTLLMCGLVSDYSREAETILDPFCGSGTTLVAAKKLGRHFLGFEISADYCAIARRRLDEVDAQPSLFAPKPEQLELP